MRIKDTSTVYSYSISVCMGSFVFGYQLSSFGNLTDLIVRSNTWVHFEGYHQKLLLLSSVLALSAIFGITLSHLGVGLYRFLIKNYGFVQTFKLTDYLTIAASCIGILSLNMGTQIISRVVFGLVVGINTIMVPTYLTSVLPGSMGGPAGTLNQLFITIGIFFGFWIGYLVFGQQSSQIGWRIIVAFPIIPALIRLHTAQHVYPYETVESMIENNDDDKLQDYLDLMYEEVTLQQFKQMKTLPDVDIIAEKATYFDPLGQSHLKRIYMATGIVFFNQLSGGAALGTFGGSVSFHSLVGHDKQSILSTFVYLNLLQVIVTLFSGQFLEKWGRRAFMMEGQRIIIVCLVLIAFIQILAPELHAFTAILTFIQMIGFSLSYGPCSFLIGTQILHDIYLPSVLLWIFIFLHGITIGHFIAAIGVGSLIFIYFIVQLIGFIYISGYLIQTQGRSRQVVYEDFRRGVFPNPLTYLKQKIKQDREKSRAKHQKQTQMELINKPLHEENY